VHSRYSGRIYWFTLLILLAAGVAAAPFHRAAAQEPSKPAQPAAQSDDTAKPEAAKPEESETDKFRHSSLVKAAAKGLHMSVEATATTFEFLNFAVIVFGLGIPLAKVLPKVIRKRSETVRHNIESARKVTEDANRRLSAVEAKLASLDDEIAGIRAQVENESREDEARIKAALTEESARIVASAEQEIDVAAAQARRGLRHFAADLAIEQAAKQLVFTPENDRALIAEFLADVNSNGAGQGGQK
jgi:F-type H+-transporting ATPase subunit b